MGGRGGSRAERRSGATAPVGAAGAPGGCARHLWSTAGLARSPASPSGLGAGLCEQWAGAPQAAPPTAVFQRGRPGAAELGREARERARWRQPPQRSGQGCARRAGRQSGTQTRAARAATLPGTDSPFAPRSWLRGGTRGRVAGRRTGETGAASAPGRLGPAAPNFGGTEMRLKKRHRRLGKPLGRARGHPGRRTPPPETPRCRPGVHTVNERGVLRPPPPPPHRRQANPEDAARELASLLHLGEQRRRSGHPTETDKRSPVPPSPHRGPKGAGGRRGSVSSAPKSPPTFISSLISLFTG